MTDAVDAKLYEQCCKVYDAMWRNSQTRLVEDGNGSAIAIYRGYTTYLLEQAGYSISNYTPIMRRLRLMGCIKQIVRGGRGIPSEWQVIKPPSRSAFARGGQRWITQDERISELEARVTSIEEQLEREQAS